MRKLSSIAAIVCGFGLSLEADALARPARDVELETVEPFVSGQDIPESVTIDDQGNVYISVGDSIWQRTADGTLSVFATLPLPIFALGVKVGPDGCVYNASTSLSEVEGAFVWRTCEAGAPEVFATLDQSGGPNDLAFDAKGNLFVTDPVLGRVWKLTPDGTPDVFVQHPLLEGDPDDPALLFQPVGVNGIAFDHGEHYLYLSNTDQGSVIRINLHSRGHWPSVFAEDPALRGADGIAFDRTGNLFVTVNARDALISINPRGRLTDLSQGGLLDAPSSIAFAAGPGSCGTFFLTSSAFSRTLGLQAGTPKPALIEGRVIRSPR